MTKTKSLKAKYQEEIISAMKEKFGYKNMCIHDFDNTFYRMLP